MKKKTKRSLSRLTADVAELAEVVGGLAARLDDIDGSLSAGNCRAEPGSPDLLLDLLVHLDRTAFVRELLVKAGSEGLLPVEIQAQARQRGYEMNSHTIAAHLVRLRSAVQRRDDGRYLLTRAAKIQ